MLRIDAAALDHACEAFIIASRSAKDPTGRFVHVPLPRVMPASTAPGEDILTLGFDVHRIRAALLGALSALTGDYYLPGDLVFIDEQAMGATSTENEQ